MSRKKDEKFIEDEDVKWPPHHVPWSNPNEVRASQKVEKAVAMEEGVPFEKKEKTTGENAQNLVAEEGIGIESPDTSGVQRVVLPSRPPDVSPGAAALDSRVHHPTVGRRTRIQDRVSPGAFREGGLDNEERDNEDELTVQSHTEPPIPPPLSAELVNIEEEEKRRQDDINQALQRERQLVQDQINQALQRERQQAVVAEVVSLPEVVSKRDRWWKFAAAFFLLALIVVGVVLGITLRPDPHPETLVPQDLIDLLSFASSDSGEALSTHSTPQKKALVWLANNTNLAFYTDQEKIQRYALATLYYSTKGDSWSRNDFWLSRWDVCGKWYQFYESTIDCTAGTVYSLNLHKNNLIGTIPAEIGMLSDSLVHLYLSENELDGTLPNEIRFLTNLASLSLGTNILTGTLPSVIGLLTNLEFLGLYDNKFYGTIPSEIGRLTKLKLNLWLHANKLTGTIPTTLGSLNLLGEMSLGYNELEGTIPTELAQCQNLKNVSFENNRLTGDVGPVINMLPHSLTMLDLDDNRLSGTVPTSIGTFTDLTWLDLGANNLHGSIPTELGLLSNLELFSLSSNRFTGTVPTSLASLSLLKDLYLFDNDLTGSLDAFCGIDFEIFTANTCGQVEINCTCCTHCCESEPSSNCQAL